MKREIATLGFALAILVCGCSRKTEDKPQSTSKPVVQPPTAQFDESGQLVASKDSYLGLVLPEGMTKYKEVGLETVLMIDSPIDPVIAYFGPKLTTGSVDRDKFGVRYNRAKIRGAESKYVTVDVSIRDIGKGRTRVAVINYPPPSAKTPNANRPPPPPSGGRWSDFD
ncbi:MAG: hypothetical protein R3A47_10135 [Polyangiales bacterium]